MINILVTVELDGNEVQLIKQDGDYFILWGEQNKDKAKEQLLTPTGKTPSQSSAHKKFLKAAKAVQYLKFNKL